MRDNECVEFLQWCLPRLDLRWAGFRKVRRTVCKRVARRVRELGLPDLAAYRARLDVDPAEWARLDALCRIPISRFYRDRAVFEALRATLLPTLAEAARARGDPELRCWSAGCASGEEVYSVAIAWQTGCGPRVPDIALTILGTDADETMLRRATTGCYGPGSLKDLPPELIDRCFERHGDRLCVRPELRRGVRLERQDLRRAWPPGPFDLILCRNVAFTYFDPELQVATLDRLDRRLRDGGYLVLGSHETLPEGSAGYVPTGAGAPIFRKRGGGS